MRVPWIKTVLLWCSLCFAGSLTLRTPEDESAGAEGDIEIDQSSSTFAPESTTRDFVEDLHSVFKNLRRAVYPYVDELVADDNISRECVGSLLALVRGIQNEEKWALMMLSSMGVLPQNVFRGSQAATGSYEQCLETERTDQDGKVSIRGQYCTLFLPPNKKLFLHAKGILGDDPFYKIFYGKDEYLVKFFGIPMAFRYGVCTPHQCTPEELNHAVDKLVNQVYGFNATITLCRTKLTTRHPNTFQSFVMVICVLLVALLIIGSVTDHMYNRREKKPVYITSCLPLTLAMMFSPQRNIRRLFAPYSAESKPLAFLNGIKVLLAAWVVYGHNVLFVSPDLLYSMTGMLELLHTVSFQVVANAFLSVTGFFFLSGFILAYMCLKESDRIKNNNAVPLVAIMFVRRYYRLVVPCLAVVSVSMLFPLWVYSSSDGLSLYEAYAGSCVRTWWTTPAMITNYVNAEEICLWHTWYLSVDLQLFIIAAALVMFLIHKPKPALWLLCVLIALSCVWIGVYSYVNGYSAVVSYSGEHPDQVLRTAQNIYLNPITHSASYLLGIICAYVTLNWSDRLRFRVRVIMWLAALTCTTYVTFITVIWYRHDFPSRGAQALFGAVHRPIFCLGLFWLTFACVNEMAPNIRSILGHPILSPLGRLAFGIYLVHPGVIALRQGLLMGQAIYPNQFLLIQNMLGCFCISVGAAFLLNIFVESPLTHLDSLIFASLTEKMKAGHGKQKLAHPTPSSLETKHSTELSPEMAFEKNSQLDAVITLNSMLPKSVDSLHKVRL